jgi:hypothetical protein
MAALEVDLSAGRSQLPDRGAMDDLTPATEFRAVDLVVRSRASLAPLLTVWDWAQTPGHIGTGAPRCLLVIPRGNPRTADKALWKFVRMVDALPRAARLCWEKASSRTFDIGIQAGLSPSCFEDVRLRPETLEAVSHLRGSILVTIYAPSRDHG